jgi:hypothetical protein
MDTAKTEALTKFETAMQFLLTHFRTTGDAEFDWKIVENLRAADEEIDRLGLAGTAEYKDAVFKADQVARAARAASHDGETLREP